MSERHPTTDIATADEQSITVRGRDLTTELVGEVGFTEFFYLHLTGTEPSPTEVRLFDAVLVTIAEHGITPSVVAARLTYDAAPEAVQGAVASGLLGAGETFLGSMEGVTRLLDDGVGRLADGESMDAVAKDVVDRYDRLPGFGHPLHTPTDPRTDRLFELLEAEGVGARQIDLLLAVQTVAEDRYQTELVVNATGAIGAVVSALELDPMVARGLALVARTAGIVGHVNEERGRPIARALWQTAEERVEYTGGDP
jgi:citrate synthase